MTLHLRYVNIINMNQNKKRFHQKNLSIYLTPKMHAAVKAISMRAEEKRSVVLREVISLGLNAWASARGLTVAKLEVEGKDNGEEE